MKEKKHKTKKKNKNKEKKKKEKRKKKKMSYADISIKPITAVFDLTQYYTVEIHALHK